MHVFKGRGQKIKAGGSSTPEYTVHYSFALGRSRATANGTKVRPFGPDRLKQQLYK
jgi:hypothetical protein